MPPYAGEGGERARRISAPPSGTAVAPSRVAPRTFALVGAVALSAGVLAAVLIGMNDRRKPPEAPVATAPSSALPAPQLAVPPPRFTAPQVLQPAQVQVNPSGAVEQLRRAFAKARLYSQISVSGDVLELRSSACEDGQLVDLLDQSSATLTESGLHRVRCLQPHGQVVFTREL